jgi:hypothetical protein
MAVGNQHPQPVGAGSNVMISVLRGVLHAAVSRTHAPPSYLEPNRRPQRSNPARSLLTLNGTNP